MKFKQIKHLPRVDGQLKQGKEGDAGYDIRANDEFILPIGKKVVVTTGIVVEIPEGYFGRVSSRSGLAAKDDITAFHGTVDSNYRGELKVILYNRGTKPFKINIGDRIAQLLVLPCKNDEPFEEVEELTDTTRGEGGFGSSGVQ